MKKPALDPIVKKEVCFMAAASLVCALLLQIGFVLFRRFDYTVALGGVIGWSLTVLNFFLMSLGVQRAVEDPERAQLRMKASYTRRSMLLLAVMIVAFVVDQIHWLPVVASVFYPPVVIFVRQFWVKYVLKETGDEPLPEKCESAGIADDEDEDGEEDEFEKMIGRIAGKIDTDYLKNTKADSKETSGEQEE